MESKMTTWTIGKKLIASFLAVAAICAVVGGVGWYGIMQLDERMDEMASIRLAGIKAVLEADAISGDLEMGHIELLNMFNSIEDARRVYRDIESDKREITQRLETFEGLISDEKEKELFAQVTSAFEDFSRASDEQVRLSSAIDQTGSRNNPTMMASLFKSDKENVEPAFDALMKSLGELVEDVNAGAEASREAGDAAASSLKVVITVSIIVGVMLAISLGVIISRAISRPVSQIASIAESISKGDVEHSIDINTRDEIGMLANSFRNLIVYMKELAASAESIASNDLTVKIEAKSE
jgi:methyl-accepting chemotaxis protein